MRIDDFLQDHFEQYLLSDLRALSPLNTVGYPIVATTVAAIELLGTLTSNSSYDPRAGKSRFVEYWQRDLYTSGPRRDIAQAVYELARHGVMHTFTVKKPFHVTHGAPQNHFTVTTDVGGAVTEVYLDAPTFASDMERSYVGAVKPAVAGGLPLAATMQARLDEMIHHHQQTLARNVMALGSLPLVLVPPPTDRTGSVG